jgi:anti-anti-sigma regulatory factor
MVLAFLSHLPLRIIGIIQRASLVFSARRPAVTPYPVSPPVPAEKRPRPAGRFEVEVLDTPAGVEVQIRGQAGVVVVGSLEAVLLRLAARRPACVIFELGKLESISTLAMGLLVTYRRAAVRAGSQVCLATDLQPVVREALDRAGLMSLFQPVGTTKPCATPAATDGRKPHAKMEGAQGSGRVTWARLAELEPKLETLLWRARGVGAGCRTFTDADHAFGPVRNELVALIGFAGPHHWHPILGSAEAYQVAYSKLYDAVAGLLPRRADDSQKGL